MRGSGTCGWWSATRTCSVRAPGLASDRETGVKTPMETAADTVRSTAGTGRRQAANPSSIATRSPPTPAAFWCRAFSETYSSELRAERKGRAEQIYHTYAERYDRLLDLVPRPAPAGAGEQGRARRAWWARRVLGKTLSVLRLLKAAFTFQNGADYLAWKIGRHAGLEIELTPWQRRHPILAAGFLFWRLYLRGAIR